MNIIVTGGAGFIGSALVWRLNELGHDDILIVDRHDETGKEFNLAALKYTDFVDADKFIADLSKYKDTDAILHMGADSSTAATDREWMMGNNFQYTADLAEFAVENDIRFIYASSAATYGDGSAGMDDGTEGLDKLRPLNLYGESKHLLDKHAAEKGWFDRIVGLKYFNVFGPNENHKGDMRSLVNKAFGQINETGKLKLFRSHNDAYADGEFGRDFIYVKDAVDMTLFFTENEIGGLFNVGSGKANTWNALGSAIFRALDREPNIEFIDMPMDLRDKYQYHTEADITRLREAGYEEAITPLETAVADYIQNYLVPRKHLGE
jgi:ADP-L-glycero-D-manno-heptose 6-epimerase